MAPTVEIEHIEALRTIVSNKVSPGEAHRVMKIWRAFWKVMAAMRLCEKDADPSLVLRNSAPQGALRNVGGMGNCPDRKAGMARRLSRLRHVSAEAGGDSQACG
jgi:hypothetical protein